MTLVDKFREIIHPTWHLKKEDAYWIVRENNQTQNSELKITGASAFVFSLDQGHGKDPWPFLNGVAGIKRVNDALLVTEINGFSYFIAIEMKSTNTTKANEQIVHAWFFSKWLNELMIRNKHWVRDWEFCGLISSTPRRQERKGTSTRKISDIEISTTSKGYRVAHIKNKKRLNLHDLHNSLQGVI